MNKYDIEYTDQKLLSKVVFTALGLFFLIEILVIWLVSDEILLATGVISGFIIPITYFLLKKRKIKRYGHVLIHPNQLIFNTLGAEKTISIYQIKQYQITYFKGVSLILQLKNGEKFHVVANSNFCNADKFGQACIEIEEAIEQLATETPSEETPVKGKTMFEKKWFIVILSIASVGVLTAIVFAITNGKKLHQLLAPSAIFIGLWAGVFNSHNRHKYNQ